MPLGFTWCTSWGPGMYSLLVSLIITNKMDIVYHLHFYDLCFDSCRSRHWRLYFRSLPVLHYVGIKTSSHLPQWITASAILFQHYCFQLLARHFLVSYLSQPATIISDLPPCARHMVTSSPAALVSIQALMQVLFVGRSKSRCVAGAASVFLLNTFNYYLRLRYSVLMKVAATDSWCISGVRSDVCCSSALTLRSKSQQNGKVPDK